MFDEVGIFFDDGGDAPLFEELLFILFQIKGDGGSLRFPVGFPECELLLAAGFPADRFTGSRFECVDNDFVGDHERGVEADAELTDQFRICGVFAFFFVFCEVFQKRFCTGVGDRTEVFNDFFPAHTDTVIGNTERFGFGVRRDADFPFLCEFRIGEGEKTRLVNRIRRIGDQFAEKDFFIGINRVDHHMKKFTDFCLKSHIFHRLRLLNVLITGYFASDFALGASCVDEW